MPDIIARAKKRDVRATIRSVDVMHDVFPFGFDVCRRVNGDGVYVTQDDVYVKMTGECEKTSVSG
jgi:hypothetical protein